MKVLTGSKHCWNQHGTTITLFSRQFEVNWVGKSYLQSDKRLKGLASAIISEQKTPSWFFIDCGPKMNAERRGA